MSNIRTVPSGFVRPDLKITISNGKIYIIALEDVVEYYNVYNRNTYNQYQVLTDVNEVFAKNKYKVYSSYWQVCRLSEDEVKELASKQGTVIYFAGDEKFVSNIIYGFRGSRFSTSIVRRSMESKW